MRQYQPAGVWGGEVSREVEGERGYGASDINFSRDQGFERRAGQCMCVIGTHHLPEFAIRFLVHVAGQNVNEISFKFEPRTVRRHEFEVSLWCLSDDEFLQQLEFALVERELAQAVGRARLLDNDVDVHVFSNFVVSGGELWK